MANREEVEIVLNATDNVTPTQRHIRAELRETQAEAQRTEQQASAALRASQAVNDQLVRQQRAASVIPQTVAAAAAAGAAASSGVGASAAAGTAAGVGLLASSHAAVQKIQAANTVAAETITRQISAVTTAQTKVTNESIR